jgi:hypothetical protein
LEYPSGEAIKGHLSIFGSDTFLALLNKCVTPKRLSPAASIQFSENQPRAGAVPLSATAEGRETLYIFNPNILQLRFPVSQKGQKLFG